MKKVLAIVGSASAHSSNHQLVQQIYGLSKEKFLLVPSVSLNTLPHFHPEESLHGPPRKIEAFRKSIEDADAVLICTPEYVFSIPSVLKNAIEWCVATTVFSQKPVGLITASAHGEKGHEELQLIMRTLEADFNPSTTLLIQGIKGKIKKEEGITDSHTFAALQKFLKAFNQLIHKNEQRNTGLS